MVLGSCVCVCVCCWGGRGGWTDGGNGGGGGGAGWRPCFLFPAALFHSGTPLVARSTAEAAGQSPLLVWPVTPPTSGVKGRRASQLSGLVLARKKTPTVERTMDGAGLPVPRGCGQGRSSPVVGSPWW